MNKRNKYLILIIIILIIAIGIVGFFAYQSYRMSQMDKLILEDNTVIGPQFDSKYNETVKLANSSSPNYAKIISNIDELSKINNQSIAISEQAYQYADGPYKDLIAISIKKERLISSWLDLVKEQEQDYKTSDYSSAANLNKQIDNINNEINSAQTEYVTFKSTHLDVKEHTIKYWNSTNV